MTGKGISIPCVMLNILMNASISLSADPSQLYLETVKPILKDRCYSCHGSLKQESSLRLDTAALALQGGDSGPAFVAGKPAESAMLARILSTDDSIRMPPEGKPLTTDEIVSIKKWIQAGAIMPEGEVPEEDPASHWSFQAPTWSTPPIVKQSAWVRTPIDAFIAARYEKESLTPTANASRSTLLRRVYFDLIGLPPTRHELLAFEADDSDQAYEKVVDRLLTSSQYGERWGRHWMDVWRYSDWYGRRNVDDVRNSYPHIWRWRDWIISSLNNDVGYDKMIQQMLAADELYPDDDDAIAATGFIVRNWYSLNYSQWKKDLVEHTGKAFLGLRLNCAMCHDHKYDPISQREYFAFQAIFEPLEFRHDRVPDGGALPKYVKYNPGSGASLKPIKAGLPRVYDHFFDLKTFMYRLGDDRVLIEGEPPVEPNVPAILGNNTFDVQTVKLPPRAWYPGLKPFVRKEELQTRQDAIVQSREEVKKTQALLAKTEANLQLEVDKERQAFEKLWYEKLNDHAVDAQQQKEMANPFLLLTAETGRRLIGLSLTNSLSKVDSLTSLTVRMKLIQDGNSQIHLGADHTNGRTAAYLGFNQGHIQTYAPQTTTVVDVGEYDFAAGQNEFLVRFQFDAIEDAVHISVTEIKTGALLVHQAATSVRKWNPLNDPKNHFALDVQQGAIAAFDDIVFGHEQDGEQLRIGFDEPNYRIGTDIAGNNDWFLMSSYNVTPAWSLVTLDHKLDPDLLAAQRELAVAASKLDVTRFASIVAQAKYDSSVAELLRLQTRVVADDAILLQNSATKSEQPAALMQKANLTANKAQLQTARYQLMLARKALMEVEAQPEDNAERRKQLFTAQKNCASARDAVLAKQQEASKDVSSLPDDDYKLGPTYPRKSTGRRSALARWIASKQNPLTARVAVNHIWMRHFGRPLVNSVVDFGRSGDKPTHPRLLDWLAVELMESGWSMKHIHRLIVTSHVYRIDSRFASGNLKNVQRDPDNHNLWRFQRRRLEAEAIRDAILHLSGRLDPQLGGKDIDPKKANKIPRRSLYFSTYPEEGGSLTFAKLFDAPDPGDCYRRSESIVPQQALAMTNSLLSLDNSRALAAKITKMNESPTKENKADHKNFVKIAFEHILSRRPSQAEHQLCCQFLDQQQALFHGQSEEEQKRLGLTDENAILRRAHESLVHSILNHADFVTFP